MLELLRGGIFLVYSTLVGGLFCFVSIAMIFAPSTFLPAHAFSPPQTWISASFPQNWEEWQRDDRQKRALGIILLLPGMFFLFITGRGLFSWIRHPTIVPIIPEKASAAEAGILVLLGIVALGFGLYFIFRAKSIVRRNFENWPTVLLVTPRVLRFWTIYFRYVGFTAFSGSLMFLVEAVRGLR